MHVSHSMPWRRCWRVWEGIHGSCLCIVCAWVCAAGSIVRDAVVCSVFQRTVWAPPVGRAGPGGVCPPGAQDGWIGGPYLSSHPVASLAASHVGSFSGDGVSAARRGGGIDGRRVGQLDVAVLSAPLAGLARLVCSSVDLFSPPLGPVCGSHLCAPPVAPAGRPGDSGLGVWDMPAASGPVGAVAPSERAGHAADGVGAPPLFRNRVCLSHHDALSPPPVLSPTGREADAAVAPWDAMLQRQGVEEFGAAGAAGPGPVSPGHSCCLYSWCGECRAVQGVVSRVAVVSCGARAAVCKVHAAKVLLGADRAAGQGHSDGHLCLSLCLPPGSRSVWRGDHGAVAGRASGACALLSPSCQLVGGVSGSSRGLDLGLGSAPRTDYPGWCVPRQQVALACSFPRHCRLVVDCVCTGRHCVGRRVCALGVEAELSILIYTS